MSETEHEIGDVFSFEGASYTWDGLSWRTNDTIILVGNTSQSVSANSSQLSVANSSANATINNTHFAINGRPIGALRAWAYVVFSSNYSIAAGEGFALANSAGSGICKLDFTDPLSSLNIAVVATVAAPIGSQSIISEVVTSRTANSIFIWAGANSVAIQANFSVMVMGGL